MKRRLLSTSVVALATAQTALISPLMAATTPDGWDLLRSVQVQEIMTETTYEVRKIFPAELRDGIEQFDLTGYVVLLWQTENISEFMLISDMGFCPFCGDPEHGTALQVRLSGPVDVLEDGQRITVRGALEAVSDPETTQSTRMTGAHILQ